MVKYINKSAVVAEIDRLQEATMDKNQNFLSSYHEGIFDGLSMLENFLDTLEVKEVNLEKELISWHKKHFKKEGTFEKYGGFYFANSSQLDLAKHFFELGLKAKIGG
jgi:hypothetical protein